MGIKTWRNHTERTGRRALESTSPKPWEKANKKCKAAELTSDIDTVPEDDMDQDGERLAKRTRRIK